MNADGTQQLQLAELAHGPDWSPDGDTIAYAVPNTNPLGLPYSFYLDIHLIAPDGSNDHQITSSEEPHLFGQHSPSWSPDGTRLAVSRAVLPAPCCRYEHDIWTMNADGTGFTNLTPDTPNSDDSHPVFSPDGTKIAFWAEETQELIVMNADGGTRVASLGSGFQPDWQPLVGPQRSDYQNAAKFCKAEREFLGEEAFRQQYGERRERIREVCEQELGRA